MISLRRPWVPVVESFCIANNRSNENPGCEVRRCRLMCGGGSAPPEVISLYFEAYALLRGRAHGKKIRPRKVTHLPHIRRLSHNRITYGEIGIRLANRL
jgi:hypothetical protein